ncbi:hypothetical protein LCGC14_0602320 [marine sediment metagenome]|uniref:Uncharacterized protein n=1 Tax=marine sediment metagenome TaxID=412755 RepID=A0A0F9UIQ1_9ZZZZ
MGGKGGGTVGTVSFPLYIENTHREWMGMPKLADDATGTPQTADQSIVDVMNSLFTTGANAIATIVAIAKADIANDEGFTLLDSDGISYVYKFDTGAGVTGEDYTVDISGDTTANDVQNTIVIAINASLKFTAETASTASLRIFQLRGGANGNQPCSDTVTDSDFEVTNFLFGTGQQSPYGAASVYDPAAPLANMQNKIDAYEALVSDIDKISDWESLTDSAVSKSASTFQATDISSAVTSILNTALTDAASSIASIRNNLTDDIDSLLDSAVAKATDMMASTPITDMVKQFQKRTEATHLRIVSRFSGGMADINAVQGSAYLMGIALLENEHAQRVEEFVSNLTFQLYNQLIDTYFQQHARYVSEELGTFVGKFNHHLRSHVVMDSQKEVNRANYINAGTGEMARLLLSKVDGAKLVASLQETASKDKIIASSEEIKQGVMYDVEDWLWDLKIYQYGANILSGASTGGQVLPEAPSQLSSTISGVLGGAAAGATTGNPYLTAAGAVIGGVGGFLEGD